MTNGSARLVDEYTVRRASSTVRRMPAATNYNAMDRALLGKSLRALRVRRGLMQRDVATKAGCTFQYISDVESGQANVTIGQLESIVRALDAELVVDVRDQDAPAAAEVAPEWRARIARIAELAPHVGFDLVDGIIVALEARAGR